MVFDKGRNFMVEFQFYKNLCLENLAKVSWFPNTIKTRTIYSGQASPVPSSSGPEMCHLTAPVGSIARASWSSSHQLLFRLSGLEATERRAYSVCRSAYCVTIFSEVDFLFTSPLTLNQWTTKRKVIYWETKLAISSNIYLPTASKIWIHHLSFLHYLPWHSAQCAHLKKSSSLLTTWSCFTAVPVMWLSGLMWIVNVWSTSWSQKFL